MTDRHIKYMVSNRRVLGESNIMATTELEEMGEETDDLADGFSKYATELEQLTGFSILEEGSTNDYKSLYDIFSGLSAVWDDLSETAQSRVSEILGGTRQLQVISSILGNWEDAEGALADAMNSTGVAMESNEIYMETIEARISVFQATLQELYTDFLDTDLVKNVVDLGTAIIQTIDNLIDSFGSLSTAIAVIGAGVGLKNLATGFSSVISSSELSSMSALDVITNTLIKAFPNLSAALGLTTTTMQYSTTAIAGTTSAFSTLWGVISANPLGAILTAVAAVAAIYNVWQNHIEAVTQAQKEAQESAVSSANDWSDSNDSLQDYISQIEDLRESLDGGTLSEEEAYEAKAELLSIQTTLSESYSGLAGNIDLVNGSLEDQILLLQQASAEEANTWINENWDAIQDAVDAMESVNTYDFSTITSFAYDTDQANLLDSILEQYGGDYDAYSGQIKLKIEGTPEEAMDAINSIMTDVRDAEEGLTDTTLLEEFYSTLLEAYGDIDDVIETFGETYEKYNDMRVESDLNPYTANGETKLASQWLNEYSEAIEEYNTALASGDSAAVADAKATYDELTRTMGYLTETNYSFGLKYSQDVNGLRDSLDEAALAAYNFQEALFDDSFTDSYGQTQTGIVDTIKEAGLSEELVNTILGSLYEGEYGIVDGMDTELANALMSLQSYAEAAGVSVTDLVALLVEAGAAIATVAEDAEITTFSSLFTDSEGEATEFSESIDDFQSDIESINDTLSSLRSGEEVNFADLVQEFPELAGQADNLEEALTNLSASKLEEFATDWQEAVSILTDEDQIAAANQYFNELLKDVDFSGFVSDVGSLSEAYQNYNKVLDEAESLGVDISQTVYGNIDTDTRQILEWTEDTIAKYQDVIDSWGWDIEEGSYSTVFGTWDTFDGVDIAFSPILQTEDGAVPLDSDTVNEYIWALLDEMPEGWTTEDLLALDAEGLEWDIDGELVTLKGLIADVGETAETTAEAMHFTGATGAIQDVTDELEAAKESCDSVYNALYTQLMSGRMDSGHARSLTDQIWEEYGITEAGQEAILKLSLNPDSANWTYEEWKANLEDQVVSIELQVSEESLENLQTEFENLESSSSVLSSELSYSEAIKDTKTLSKTYKALIKNSKQQVQNLKKQNNELETQKQLAIEAGQDYSEIQQQIDSNTSSIYDAIQSQLEWNEAVLSLDYDAAAEGLDNLNTAISESKSSTGLSTESIQNMLDIVSQIDGFDASTLFEQTTSGVNLNAEAVAQLTDEYQELLKTNLSEGIADQLSDLNSEYSTTKTVIDALGDSFDDLSESEQEAILAEYGLRSLDDINNDIIAVQLLASEYEGLISKYNAWQTALSAGNERDAYDSISSEFEDMQDIFNRGWYGDDSLNSYLDLLLGDNRTGDVAADWAKLTETIDGTSHSLLDYWTLDENGATTVDGLYDFLEDVNAVLGDEYASFSENGYSFDFSGDKIYDVAEAFGMSTEMIDLFCDAMTDAGFIVDRTSDELGASLLTLKDAQDAGAIDGEIDLDFEIDEMSEEEIQDKIAELTETKAQLELDPDLENQDELITQVDTLIAALEDQGVQLAINTYLDDGSSEMSISDLLALDDEQLATTLGITVTEDTDFDSIRAYLEGLQEDEITASINLALENGETVDSLLAAYDNGTLDTVINCDTTELDAAHETLLEMQDEEVTADYTIQIQQDQYDELVSLLSGNASVTVSADTDEVTSDIQSVQDIFDEAPLEIPVDGNTELLEQTAEEGITVSINVQDIGETTLDDLLTTIDNLPDDITGIDIQVNITDAEDLASVQSGLLTIQRAHPELTITLSEQTTETLDAMGTLDDYSVKYFRGEDGLTATITVEQVGDTTLSDISAAIDELPDDTTNVQIQINTVNAQDLDDINTSIQEIQEAHPNISISLSEDTREALDAMEVLDGYSTQFFEDEDGLTVVITVEQVGDTTLSDIADTIDVLPEGTTNVDVVVNSTNDEVLATVKGDIEYIQENHPELTITVSDQTSETLGVMETIDGYSIKYFEDENGLTATYNIQVSGSETLDAVTQSIDNLPEDVTDVDISVNVDEDSDMDVETLWSYIEKIQTSNPDLTVTVNGGNADSINSLNDLLNVEDIEITATLDDQTSESADAITETVGALDEEEAHPLVETDDQATEQIEAVESDLNTLGKETAIPTITAKDLASDIISDVSSSLDTLDGKTATTYVETVTTSSSSSALGSTTVSESQGAVLGWGQAQGTAHAQGTAYGMWSSYRHSIGAWADGSNQDWALPHDETALVNEEGCEGLVRNGVFSLIPGGAHFQAFKRGDIIFSKDQTTELLRYGKVISGGGHGITAHADGTAYNMLNLVPAHATGASGSTNFARQTTTQTTTLASSATGATSTTTTTTTTSDSSSSDDSDETTALETFQEWAEQFIDWIATYIEKASDRIDRYIAKAENAETTGNYKTASQYYQKAISATAKQIDDEETAAEKYSSQGDAVLQEAVSLGLISSSQVSEIKTKVKDGTLAIEDYNEEVREVISSYEEWADLAEEAENSIDDLNSSILSYVDSLKEMRDAQRDAKLEMIDMYTTASTASAAYTSSEKNTQLNYENAQLEAQNEAYATNVANIESDTTSLGSTIVSSIKTEKKSDEAKSNDEYKTALKNAQKAINNQEKVDSSDLKVIKQYSSSMYSQLKAWNEAVDNLETARLEESVAVAQNVSSIYDNIAEKYANKDEQVNDRIEKLTTQADAADTAEEANALLQKASKQYDTIVSNDQAEISEYQSDLSSLSKTINKSAKGDNYSSANEQYRKNIKSVLAKVRSAVNSESYISSSLLAKLEKYVSKGYVSSDYLEACYRWNNALAKLEEAEDQLIIDQAEAKVQQEALQTQMLQNIEDEYDTDLSLNESQSNLLEAQQAKKTATGASLTEEDYEAQKKLSQEREKIYTDELAAVEEYMKELDPDSDAYTQAAIKCNELATSIAECQTEQIELDNSIINLDLEKFEDLLDLLDSVSSYYSSILSYQEATGQLLTEADYWEAWNAATVQASVALDNANKYYSYLQQALANGEAGEGFTYGEMTAEEWQAAYYDALSEYESLLTEAQQYINDMVNVPFEITENNLGAIEAYQSLLEAQASLKETQGWSLDTSDYLAQINNLNDEITQLTVEQQQAYADYLEAYANGGEYYGYYGGKTTKEWLEYYYELTEEIAEAEEAQEELNNAIIQLPYDTIEAYLELLDAIDSYNASVADLKSAMGEDLSEQDYLTQIDDNNDQLIQLYKEYYQAQEDYENAVNNGGVYGGLTSDEWLTKCKELGTEINNVKIETEELKDSLRDDVYWRTFERAHDACENWQTVLEGVIDLIDDDMLFDADGNITDFGVAQLSNYLKLVEEAQTEVQNYANDIDNLNQLYEEGWYTQDEYNEKLAELQEGMLDAASTIKDSYSEVIDILKSESEAELEALQDVISARSDALSAKKSCA